MACGDEGRGHSERRFGGSVDRSFATGYGICDSCSREGRYTSINGPPIGAIILGGGTNQDQIFQAAVIILLIYSSSAGNSVSWHCCGEDLMMTNPITPFAILRTNSWTPLSLARVRCHEGYRLKPQSQLQGGSLHMAESRIT